MKKIYFILVVLIGLNTYTFAQCNNSDDYAALYAFYNSTNGDNWDDKLNWDVSAIPPAVPVGLDMSNWWGITCDGGRVTEIFSNSNNLTGNIPTQLEKLTNLQSLYLNYNSLTGGIPSQLGNLTNLQQLQIFANQLTGAIPFQLGNLDNLTTLYLSGNNLTGSIPSELGNLSSLVSLYLSNNGLTGSIPSELGNLSSLKYLELINNQLTGSIPSELGNLSSLLSLYLLNNGLTGSIPSELGNLGSLLQLSFGENQLTGSIPSELGNLDNLKRLDLWSNALTGSIPIELGNLNNLELLNLFDNQLTGSIPVELGNLGSLVNLELTDNVLTGSIPSELGSLGSLLYLKLDNNALTGSIPSELGNLGNLERLYLSNNQLTGSIPSELGNLGNLERLLFLNNQLIGSIPIGFNQLSNLTDFDISNNQLSGCYDPALKDGASVLCNFGNAGISAGNTFDAPWESFCNSNAGSCCQTNIWTGNVDANWEAVGNWSKGHIPMDCENIIISGLGTTVNINSANASVASISIVNGNTLNVKAGAVLTINGDLNTLSTDGVNISGNNSIVNNAGSIICSNIKRRGLNINFGGVFNNSNSLQITGFNQHIQAYNGIEVYEMGQMTNTGSITINSSVSNFDTDGISCKSGAAFTNSGSITIANIQGANSEGITNEATFTNENIGAITINTVGSSFGLLNSSVDAYFSNNGSISINNTFLSGVSNTNLAVFGGSGSVSMNTFDNLASLAPGNSPGAITLNGHLNITNNYTIEIDSKSGIGTGHDHVQVNGDVNLSGTIHITNNTPGGTLLDDDKFVVLSYTGTRTGTFVDVKMDLFPANWTVSYDAQFCGKCIVVHGPNAALPVELSSFIATKMNNEVELSWITNTEINNKGFYIQHSTDAKNWLNITWVDGKSASSSKNFYQYIHRKPTNGYNYYRLQQIDFDEEVEYSKILNVVFENGQNITFYPNPAKDELFIAGENLNNTILEIFNSTGQKIRTTFLDKGEKVIRLDVSNLGSGLYIMTILHGNGQQVSKQIHIMRG